MKGTDELEARLKTELLAALRRAAGGRSPAWFSLSNGQAAQREQADEGLHFLPHEL